MHNIDAKTPRLMVIKRLFDAYCTRDTKNVLPLLAKGFISQSFPKSPELPDEARGSSSRNGEKYSHFLSRLKYVSGVRNLLPTRNLISPTPRSTFTK